MIHHCSRRQSTPSRHLQRFQAGRTGRQGGGGGGAPPAGAAGAAPGRGMWTGGRPRLERPWPRRRCLPVWPTSTLRGGANAVAAPLQTVSAGRRGGTGGAARTRGGKERRTPRAGDVRGSPLRRRRRGGAARRKGARMGDRGERSCGRCGAGCVGVMGAGVISLRGSGREWEGRGIWLEEGATVTLPPVPSLLLPRIASLDAACSKGGWPGRGGRAG